MSPISERKLPRLLLADDEPLYLDVLSKECTRLGYDVTAASNGYDALRSLDAPNPPRIAIVDWTMPSISGPELCERVRAVGGNTYTYLILMTVRDEMSDVAKGLSAGADDYVVKPFDRLSLQARLNVGRRVLAYADDMASTVEQLATANQTLSAFSRALAHDLRNTITSVGGHAALLAESDAMRDEDVRIPVDEIQRAAQRMKLLVDDVLLLETTARQHHREWFDPREVILDAAADAPGIRLTVGELPHEINAGRASVQRAFKNLLENAARYGRAPDRDFVEVVVSGEEDETTWTFSVADDGPGVTPMDESRIFEAFRRGSASRHSGGVGLGLSIVAACAKAHGGEAWVRPARMGGAEFKMSFRKRTETTDTSPRRANDVSHAI